MTKIILVLILSTGGTNDITLYTVNADDCARLGALAVSEGEATSWRCLT
ncbi:MAG: hypothetical protein AAF681_12165 [Pseudomonadota bacterium]